MYITIAYFNTFVNFNKSQIFTHSSILEIACTKHSAIVLLLITVLGLSNELSVTLFNIASVLYHILINRAECAPGDGEIGSPEASTCLESFKNFLGERYSFLSDFDPSLELAVYILFVVTIFFVLFLGFCRTKDKKTTAIFLSFQNYCCENQKIIFVVTLGLIFVLNLNGLTVCEAILGFMFLSYFFGLSYLAYIAKFPVVWGYLMLSSTYNLGFYGFPWHYVCIGFLLLYTYNLAVILFPVLDLESTFNDFTTAQANVAQHMLKEMEYFHVLEQLLFLYWGG